MSKVPEHYLSKNEKHKIPESDANGIIVPKDRSVFEGDKDVNAEGYSKAASEKALNDEFQKRI